MKHSIAIFVAGLWLGIATGSILGGWAAAKETPELDMLVEKLYRRLKELDAKDREGK